MCACTQVDSGEENVEMDEAGWAQLGHEVITHARSMGLGPTAITSADPAATLGRYEVRSFCSPLLQIRGRSSYLLLPIPLGPGPGW